MKSFGRAKQSRGSLRLKPAWNGRENTSETIPHAPSVHPFIAQSAVKYPCAAAAAGYYHRAPRAARRQSPRRECGARARQVRRKTRRNAANFIGYARAQQGDWRPAAAAAKAPRAR